MKPANNSALERVMKTWVHITLSKINSENLPSFEHV